jgi:hypothetical protein
LTFYYERRFNDLVKFFILRSKSSFLLPPPFNPIFGGSVDVCAVVAEAIGCSLDSTDGICCSFNGVGTGGDDISTFVDSG